MIIYTIGFAQKSAEEFFGLLIKHGIECLVDVRLNNVSQLAGFTKSKDLKYFLNQIGKIDYIHSVKYAPTKEILDDYKKNKITWNDYENKYNQLITQRRIEILFNQNVQKYNKICLLCSESTPTNCHRRLLAEYLNDKLHAQIQHL